MSKEFNELCNHMEDSIKYAFGGIIPKMQNVKCDDPLLHIMNQTHRPFRELAKLIEKSQDTVKHRNWDFNLAHLDLICIDEVTKTLSREDPIVIIQTGTHSVKKVITNAKELKGNPEAEEITKDVKYIEPDKSTIIVFIHSSIVVKAELINITIPKWLHPTYKPSVFIGYCDLSTDAVIAWVKEVKSAKWGKAQHNKHCRVIIPKI